MGTLIGMAIGSTIAMLLSGYLVAWIIRKIARIGKVPSYVIGVSAMTFVGAWSITYEGSPSFFENWVQYLIGAAIALPLMIAKERRVLSPDALSKNGTI